MKLLNMAGTACCAIFIFMACAQKKEAEPPRGTDVQVTEVDLPQADWQKTIVIASADSDAVSHAMTRSIARKLGRRGVKIILADDAIPEEADYIIKTRALHQDDAVEISYILENTSNDSVIENSIRYEEESVLSAVETVSREMAQSMGEPVSQTHEEKAVSNRLFQQYVEAESLRTMEMPAELNSAVRIYKEILRNDSLYADAWIGLAESYLMLFEQGWERHMVWLSLAQQSGMKVEQLQPGTGEGSCILGRIAMIRGDIRHAEQLFRTALNQNPNIQPAWTGLGQIFVRYGLYDPALRMYDRSLELNPSSLQAGIGKALILGGQGEHQLAAGLLRKCISDHPQAVYLNTFLALQLYYQGEYGPAMESVRMGMSDGSYQPLSHAVLAMIHAKQGDLDEALSEVELEVKPQADGNGALATAVAAVYALLGRNGESVQWLNKAVDWGYQEYLWLIRDPNFEPLRNDERFRAVCDTLKIVYDSRRNAYFEQDIL
ncbi:tetratricopeptide repeat protein [bacterium]|nr:tetratricopeptide repeat protein [bacterium]